MYGWLEPSSDPLHIFTNSHQDVLLRSSTFGNNLILGNAGDSQVTAGMYISSNIVGIKKIPNDINYSLDILGNVLLDGYLDIGSNIHLTSERLALSNDSYIKYNGLIENSVIITKYVQTNVGLASANVVNLSGNTSQYTMTLDIDLANSLATDVEVDTFFRVQAVLFRITRMITSREFSFVFVFPNESTGLTWNVGATIDIEVLNPISPNSASKTIDIPMNILSITKISNRDYEISADLLDVVDRAFVINRKFYSFKQSGLSNNIVQLVRITSSGTTLTMTVNTRMDLGLKLGLVDLVLQDVVFPLPVRDNDVFYGTAMCNNKFCLLLKHSSIQQGYQIRYVNLGDIISYNVFDSLAPLNEHVVLDIGNGTNTNSLYAYTSTGVITYTLEGVPLIIRGIESGGNNFRYVVDDPLFMIPKLGSHGMSDTLINGVYINVLNGVGSNYLDFESEIQNAVVGSYIHVLAFKDFVVKKLARSDVNCAITGNLGIGTLTPFEKLSVAGDCSIYDTLYINASRSSDSRFAINFVNDQLSMNEQVLIDKNNGVKIIGDLAIGNIQFTKDRLALSNSAYIKYNGLIENDVIITKYVQTHYGFTRAIVLNLIGNPTQYTMTLSIDLANDVAVDNFFRVQSVLFRITRVTSRREFSFVFVFPNESSGLSWDVGATIDIEVLNPISSNSSSKTIDIQMNIVSIAKITERDYKITADLIDSEDRDFVINNKFYSFEQTGLPSNITQLVRYSSTSITRLNMSVNTQTPDFDKSLKLGIVGLILQDVVFPAPFRDNDVFYGTTLCDNKLCLSLKHSSIQPGYQIKYINLADFASYNVFATLAPLSNGDVVLDIGNGNNTNSLYAYTSTGVVTYTLEGVPLVVRAIENFRYVVDDPLFMMPKLAAFSHGNMLINGVSINVLNAVGNNYLEFETEIPNVVIGSYIHVLAFKNFVVQKLAKNDVNCTMSENLGIGTSTPFEKLSVVGDCSIFDTLYINSSRDNTSQFAINFVNDQLSLNKQVLIDKNNGVTVTGDLAIDGLASAKQFLTVSDMRVKKNIKRANGENDMRLLRKIKIHNYVLKSGNCVQKGVLAQEVEKHVPHIVHSIKGVLTSICDYKSVTKQGKVVF
jgi:small nuclear ribonucleoprotein (snRNP)-like protein